VHTFMTFVVIPLSAIGPRPFQPRVFATFIFAWHGPYNARGTRWQAAERTPWNHRLLPTDVPGVVQYLVAVELPCEQWREAPNHSIQVISSIPVLDRPEALCSHRVEA
jgi:hypothetical protein